MTEAPLEALARLEAKLEHLHTHTTHDTGDLEDAVRVVRSLVEQLREAGAPIYGEKALNRFLDYHYLMSEHSLTVARERLAQALQQDASGWAREADGYALALASFANWTAARAGTFGNLEATRQGAAGLMSVEWPGRPFDKAQRSAVREMAGAFLFCTEPSAIASWLKENPEEKS